MSYGITIVIAIAVIGVAIIIADLMKDLKAKQIELDAINAGLEQKVVDGSVFENDTMGTKETLRQVIWTKPNA